MQTTCVNCHFFTKTHHYSGQKVTFPLTTKERGSVAADDWTFLRDGGASLHCYRGVWDEGLPEFEKGQRFSLVTSVDRRDGCFFWPHRPGMMLPVAKELEQREADRSKTNREHRFTQVGLWIAALALLAQLVVSIIELIRG